MNTLDEVRAGVTIITAQRCHDQICSGDEISRKRNKGLWRGVLFAVMVSCFGAATLVDGSTANAGFAEGQEWSVKSLTQSTTKVIIGRIEPWRDKIAVHISIVDIPVSQETGAFHISKIVHIPFEESALAASVDKLIATGVPPARDFDSGYKQWKEHNGGIFTVPIAEGNGMGR